MAPNEVNYENQEDLWYRLYEQNGQYSCSVKPKFVIGDHVLVSKSRDTIEQGGDTKWKREIMVVSEVLATECPPVYRLNDLQGEEILGMFYEEELQKVRQPASYRLERIERERGRTKEYLVKWLGYPEEFNSWVEASELA